jgi:hypothetical protein
VGRLFSVWVETQQRGNPLRTGADLLCKLSEVFASHAGSEGGVARGRAVGRKPNRGSQGLTCIQNGAILGLVRQESW